MGFTVITLCNWGYRQLARNLNMSLRRVGEKPATIYVPDKLTHDYLRQRGEPCVLLEDRRAPRTAGEYMDADFARIVRFKLRVIGSALACHGKIFFVDPDVVFLKPYAAELTKLDDARFDFTAQLNPDGTVCMGVVLIRSSEMTRAIFPSEPPASIDNDEVYANRMIRDLGCTVSGLPPKSWVLGVSPFDGSAICYHFNYRVGLKAKVKDMTSARCWYVGATPTVFTDNWFMRASELSAIEKLIKSNYVRSVLEIGVNRGETAKKLLDACPEIVKYTGIDITDDGNINVPPHQRNNRERAGKEVGTVARDDVRFDVFMSKLGSRDFKSTQQYDLVFIDGNHAYDWVKYDTELAEQLNARVIMWHDYGTEPGVTKLVDELRGIKKIPNTRLAYKVRGE